MSETVGNGRIGTVGHILASVVAAVGILVTYTLWAMSRDDDRNMREQARAEIVAARITKLEVVVEDLRETVRDLKVAVERANNDSAHRQLREVPR